MGEKAVLLSFRIRDNADGRLHQLLRQVPTKFADYTEREFREGGFRVVPQRRRPSRGFIGKERGADAVLREHRRLWRG